jgi:putative transposase
MAEALNGTYKAEPIHRRQPWKTRLQAEFATIEWIDCYNTTRLHGEIGHIPPLEREVEWHQANMSTIMLSIP